MTISVALCTFNGSRFIDVQLQSILKQQLPVDELVIVDDNSTDGTKELLMNYAENFPSLIRLYFNQKVLGAKANFEKAISLCNGDLIFLADQDDEWLPVKTQICVEFFKKQTNALLLFTDGSLMDENGEIGSSSLWVKWGFDEDLRDQWKKPRNAAVSLLTNHNKITGATVVINKSLKSIALPFPSLPLTYWHDAWLGLCAAAKNGLFFIDTQLINYRVHTGQQVGVGNGLQYQSDNNTQKKKNSFADTKYPKKLLRIISTRLQDSDVFKQEILLYRELLKEKETESVGLVTTLRKLIARVFRKAGVRKTSFKF